MRTKLQLLLTAFVVAVLSIGTAYSQSFQIVSSENEISDGKLKLLKSHAVIKNISSSAKQMKITLTPVNLTAGHLFYTCTKVTCYSPVNEVFITDPFSIAAGESLNDETYYLALVPYDPDVLVKDRIGVVGNSTIKVRFANTKDDNDAVEYTVVFHVTETGDVTETWTKDTELFPNPVTYKATIRFAETILENSIINVYNSNGDLVQQNNVNSGSTFVELNTGLLNSGAYIYTISTNGKVVNSGNFTKAK